MKRIDYLMSLQVRPAGYGHNEIIYYCGNGVVYSGVTNNTLLTDRMQDEDCPLWVYRQACRIARQGGRKK